MDSGSKIKGKRQEEVLEILNKNGGWMTPTALGQALGKTYDRASSFMSPILKRMETLGLVERNERGHARVKQVNDLK